MDRKNLKEKIRENLEKNNALLVFGYSKEELRDILLDIERENFREMEKLIGKLEEREKNRTFCILF
nr:hypothetical protein [Marseillevirus cajuinensis]WRK65455.1 hypothetical protein MarFTME_410 [Marseillevirus futianmevirus]